MAAKLNQNGGGQDTLEEDFVGLERTLEAEIRVSGLYLYSISVLVVKRKTRSKHLL